MSNLSCSRWVKSESSCLETEIQEEMGLKIHRLIMQLSLILCSVNVGCDLVVSHQAQHLTPQKLIVKCSLPLGSISGEYGSSNLLWAPPI